MKCELCERTDVDERSWQEQNGRTLCLHCVGLYTDDELNDKLQGDNDARQEV